jgi:hypothetical protein
MDGSGYGLPNGGYGHQSPPQQHSTMNTNGWADHDLNEDNFSEPQGVSVKSFDAFRMLLAIRSHAQTGLIS